jgi:hypothetical protein
VRSNIAEVEICHATRVAEYAVRPRAPQSIEDGSRSGAIACAPAAAAGVNAAAWAPVIQWRWGMERLSQEERDNEHCKGISARWVRAVWRKCLGSSHATAPASARGASSDAPASALTAQTDGSGTFPEG